MTTRILRIDASARHTGSVSRALTDRIIARFDDAEVTTRDLSENLPLLDEAWITANFTAPENRSAEQVQTLALSDRLVAELQAADTLVVGLPIYNFGVPAGFKAWIDLIARVGMTFRYTADGPEGLLQGKRAIVAVASGGTEVGSEVDFAARYVEHMLGFVGITEVTFVSADRLALDNEATLRSAYEAVEALRIAA